MDHFQLGAHMGTILGSAGIPNRMNFEVHSILYSFKLLWEAIWTNPGPWGSYGFPSGWLKPGREKLSCCRTESLSRLGGSPSGRGFKSSFLLPLGPAVVPKRGLFVSSLSSKKCPVHPKLHQWPRLDVVSGVIIWL